MSTPYGLPSTWSSIHASSISSDSGVKLAPPSTPKPPARLTAATTSRQWLKANSGKSTPTRSRMTFMPVSIHSDVSMGHSHVECDGIPLSRHAVRGISSHSTLVGDGWSVEAELVALDVLHHEARLVEAIGTE